MMFYGQHEKKLTVAQAAFMGGVTVKAIYLAIKQKRLVASRRYGRIVIDAGDAAGYALRCRSAKNRQRIIKEREEMKNGE